MTVKEILDKHLGDSSRQCVWQIVPDELPRGVNLAIELWLVDHEHAHMFVYHPHYDGGHWFNNVERYNHYVPGEAS